MYADKDQLSTELWPGSPVDCSVKFESPIHPVSHSNWNMRDNKNKHSGRVSYIACSTFSLDRFEENYTQKVNFTEIPSQMHFFS